MTQSTIRMKMNLSSTPNKSLAHCLAGVMFLIFLLKTDICECSRTANSENSHDIRVNWGIPDCTAVVGKLFEFSIPPEAFSGSLTGLKWEVIEAVEGQLPNWLLWNVNKRELTGVPDFDALGPHHIQVSVLSQINKTHGVVAAKDVFTIHVREDTFRTSNKLMSLEDKSDVHKEVRCGENEKTVSLSILLDVDLEALNGRDRIELLANAEEAIGVPVAHLRLHHFNYGSNLRRQQIALKDPTAAPPPVLFNSSPQQSVKGLYLTWRVGCGEEVRSDLQSLVSDVERKVASGELAAHLQYSIINWAITSGKLVGLKRKRQIGTGITPTPTFNPTPYTRVITAEIRPVTRPPLTPRYIPPTTTTTTRRVSYTTRRRTQPATTTLPPPVTRKPYDNKPRLFNPIVQINCQTNRVCVYPVPKDTFKDDEDNKNTHQLKLELAPLWNVTKSDPDFMYLIGRREKQIYGLPMKAGSSLYRLTASDSSGLSESDSFTVHVTAEEPRNFNHAYKMKVKGQDYNAFMSSAKSKVDLVLRTTEFMGDRTVEHVSIRDYSRGSVIMTYSNNSMPDDYCQLSALGKILSRMARPNGRTKSGFKNHMQKYGFIVSSVELELEGSCKADRPKDTTSTKTTGRTTTSLRNQPSTSPTSPVPPVDSSGKEAEKEMDEGNLTKGAVGLENMLVSTILPIIIICILLILAVLVACCLYRRNRKNKQAKDEAKNAFVSKGAPVIFPDEVEPEEKEILASTPMLIREERGPLQPPPETHHHPSTFSNGNNNNNKRTPSRGPEYHEMSERLGSSHPMSHGGGLVTEHENPLYRPPPPIELTHSRSPRPKHNNSTLPHQREPPPYIAP